MSKRDAYLQMGTGLDPDKVKVTMGADSGEINNRIPSGTGTFAAAFRLRDYVTLNQRPDGENVFEDDSRIKKPISDKLAGTFLDFNWFFVPNFMRPVTNFLVNSIDSILNGIGKAFSAVTSTIFGRVPSETMPRPVANHPNEGSLEIKPSKDGYEVNTVHNGQEIRSTFSADTRPGKLCKEVLSGTEKAVGKKVAKVEDLPPSDPPLLERAENIEEEKENFDASDVPDDIVDQYVGEHEGPILSTQNNEQLAGETRLDEEGGVAPVAESTPSYKLPDLLQGNLMEENIETDERPEVQTSGINLSKIPSVEDPFVLDVEAHYVDDQINEEELLGICADAEPDLEGYYEVELSGSEVDGIRGIQLRKGEEYLFGNISVNEHFILSELTESHHVTIKGEEASVLNKTGINAFKIDGKDYSMRKLIDEVEAGLDQKNINITPEILERCEMNDQPSVEPTSEANEIPTPKESDQRIDASEPEVQATEEEVNQEPSVESIFYKHKVPGDPQSMSF